MLFKYPGQTGRGIEWYNVVIVSDGINKVGVIVDELLTKEEIVIKSLPSYFAKVQGISGASILADGIVSPDSRHSYDYTFDFIIMEFYQGPNKNYGWCRGYEK